MTARTFPQGRLLGIATALTLAVTGLTSIAVTQAGPGPTVAVIHAQSPNSGPATHHDTSLTLASMAGVAGPSTPLGTRPITPTGTETITYTLLVGSITNDFSMSVYPLGIVNTKPGRSYSY